MHASTRNFQIIKQPLPTDCVICSLGGLFCKHTKIEEGVEEGVAQLKMVIGEVYARSHGLAPGVLRITPFCCLLWEPLSTYYRKTYNKLVRFVVTLNSCPVWHLVY
jgi:hypothetical protein